MTRSIFDHLDNSPAPSSASWPSRQPPSPALKAARAALKAQASKTIAREVKISARNFILFPALLDNIEIGLSFHSTRGMVQSLMRIKESRQEFIALLGGVTQGINLQGALLYARYLCAKKHQLAKRRETTL